MCTLLLLTAYMQVYMSIMVHSIILLLYSVHMYFTCGIPSNRPPWHVVHVATSNAPSLSITLYSYTVDMSIVVCSAMYIV